MMIVLIVAVLPAQGSAADMWSETPDLNSEAPPELVEPVRISSGQLSANLWAETPDLDSLDHSDALDIERGVRFVQRVLPEMYAETTDLNRLDQTAMSESMPAEGMLVVERMNHTSRLR